MLRFRGWGSGVFALLIPCFLLTAFYKTWTWMFITVFYVTLLVALLAMFIRQGRQIDVQQRVVRSILMEQDLLDVEVEVKLQRVGLMWLGLHTEDHRRMFLPGKTKQIHYQYATKERTSKRGKYMLPPVVVEGGDALGWFVLKRKFDFQDVFWVFPRPELPKVYRASWGRKDRMFSDMYSARHLSRDGDLRQFQMGDSLRYVDWKAAARSENLYVRERLGSEMDNGWIVVPDCGWGNNISEHMQEKVIRMAAALMADIPHRLPGLLTSDSQSVRFVLPGQGSTTERMHQLAEWDASHAMKLAAVLSNLKRTQDVRHRLLVITPRLSPTCIQVLESYVPGMVWQLSSTTDDLRRLQHRGWVTIGPDEKVVDSHAN